MTETMDSTQFSSLSSLRGEHTSGDYVQGHYKESYRLAIDRLLSGGRDSYEEFLKGERIGSFLSEEELGFITSNAKELPPQTHVEEIDSTADSQSSSGTYWPVHSDVDAPALELGWPEVTHENRQTNIDLLYHPPRQNSPTIKEVILKNIRDARQVIAIVMDLFTDVDILKETVDASVRGVPVYVLLDDFHLKPFFTAAENQDIKLKQLRNMRVRTVKGEDYLCRSGTKFNGVMEQKFILFDCHTVIYGSYRFTWSCAKISLSMVQVITGHLVRTYDEEFRTLYARSTVPAELCQPDQSVLSSGHNTTLQGWPKYSPHSTQMIDRRDQLRHTLDSVYRKTCERNQYARDCNDNHFLPVIEHDIGLQNHMSKIQSAESINYFKRHSYAGERHDGQAPQNVRARASNWNICRETGIGKNNYQMDNNYLVPQMYRSQKLRQSYNGNDKQILFMQQNMPTLKKTSKSFMRTLRIESYLQNPDVPSGEPSDYLDQFEPPNSYMQGRMRSSLVLRSSILEQMEANSHINNTPSVDSRSALHNPLRYSSMQWNPKVPPESNRLNNEEFMLKRKSLQILDDYSSGKNSYPSAYASLGRVKRGQVNTNRDMLSDSWHKRHSVADPRSNTAYTQDSSGTIYGAFARMQIERGSAAVNMKHSAYGSNLNEDQRSVSHYDVKSMTDTNSPCTSIWQEPPSRTLSAASLGVDHMDLTTKSNRLGSQNFLKKSTKKIKSFLNIPDKKEDRVRGVETSSVTSEDSTDTIKAEDESWVKHHHSNSSQGHDQNHQTDENYSKPRFRTEEHRHTSPVSSSSDTTSQSKLDIGDKKKSPDIEVLGWSKDRKADNRLYSRFEPFCSIQKKQSSYSPYSSMEKTKNPLTDHTLSRLGRGHHENKIEKFFHRVGNLIHKTK
ncbi:protein FAM83B [Syngnathoides biaculeatus]|uniref:protein FAM83B n=1 Tax=Syngnathoides biaculeatus TaxID=300417 RepID=UPI002ADD7A3B|nr:protein FAM83B [Syngnathoides biaculeatus]